jgi:demethylmenaquinone methyltransferase/2-methoxy-6-polyprenyl-1,4-benzoquinol methylase
VGGSNTPISRAHSDGNTYQRRTLDDGAEYEVLKNFPSSIAVREAIQPTGAQEATVRELEHYWYDSYEVASSA